MKNRWRISRRTMLRAGGIAIGLPLLEQMVPAAHAASSGPKRLIVMFKPSGMNMRQYLPASTGPDFALPPTMSPLAPYRDQLLVVSGLQNKVALPQQNLHLAGIASFLTGVRPTTSRCGISLDQVLASAWKGTTSLPSLEIGGNMGSGEFNSGSTICEELPCSSASSVSYADETHMKPTEKNPQALFDRVFAKGLVAPPSQQGPTLAEQRQAVSRKSILSFVMGQTERLKSKLGVSDRRRMDEYLTSVRELETRITTVSQPGGTPVSCSASRPRNDVDYPTRLKAMTELVALAVQCDATRVITFMLAEAESEYDFPVPGIGAGEGHHSTSHHGNRGELLSRYAAIDKWYVEFVALLAGKLQAAQEGAGTVLDNTIIVHGSEVSDGDTHSYEDIPILLVGGGGGVLPTGRHVRVPGDRPLADLHLTLLNLLAVPRSNFGNSSGTLSL